MSSRLSKAAELRLFLRFAAGLRRYARERPTAEDCRARVERSLRDRADNFLHVLRHGVYPLEGSVYRRLFAHAGIELGDVERAVRAGGLEAALGMLFDAGVRLGLDEFKGRTPIRRGSLSIEPGTRAFDNPLSGRHLAGQTGGSRGGGGAVFIDLDGYAYEAAYQHHMLAAHGLLDRPHAFWCPTLPYTSGVNELLRFAKTGLKVERWFAQSRASLSSGWKFALLTAYLVRAGRLHGLALPSPELVPLGEARRIAEWMAAKREAGMPAEIRTNPASGVRVCKAAKEAGLDISGTVFRCDSEPLTPARAAIFEASGCRALSQYGMTEVGLVALPCARPNAVDDVHLITDKLALILREQVLPGGQSVQAHHYTTLLTYTPKLLINVAMGDHSAVEHRSCGCGLDGLGYGVHLHTIRSHEKLTSEGMNFLGHDLIRLLEEVLPARFGGGPTDYQLVEREEDGLPRVELVVSPAVGPADEAELAAAVLAFLDRVPGANAAYGERWRDGQTLRVVRREPYATGAQKVLALHMLKPGPAAARDTGRPTA